ncbi:MAG: hypothetical protein A3E01_13030 [Gammaproteobacteria bacterium RIFCSPHIGHO2_12_FULL_63_22]|nr:MAG: hypothetical protein A3E01_13030 [Gammaproteobacteria bacterium RIFCSPHIGHO2_12_FULL_63_22]
MKIHSLKRLLLPAAMLMASQALYAAEGAGPKEALVEITPKLIFFNYYGGVGSDRVHFLERYNYQEGIDADRGSDFWFDVDVNIKVTDEERDRLIIQRSSFGRYNHRNTLRADWEHVGVSAYFRQFRSATGGLDYLFSPGQVSGGTDASYFYPAQTNTNSGYVAQYNDDTQNQDFNIKRSSFGLGLKLKPAMFDDFGSVAVRYDGYRREGRQLLQYALGGNDIRQSGTNASTNGRVLHRWRGVDQQVDEDNRRVSVTATMSPGNLFQLAYDFSLDRFDNNARNGIHSDVNQYLPAQWQYDTSADGTRPLGFVPDSNLMSHGLRVSKSFSTIALAAGYGQSRLEQDTFSQPQERLGFDTGKISTENAYLNFSSHLSEGISLDGFYKFYQRDNDSSYPVIGLLNQAAPEQLGVRINRIESDSYGLSSGFRSRGLKTSFLLAWKHEDKSRDLTFHDTTLGPPAVNGISAERSFYSERSKYDEVSLRMVSQLGKGVTLRLTPSYLWASETALVTDPSEQFKVKASLTYIAPGGTFFNGYYNYASKSNDDHSLLGTDGVLVTQDMDRTATSAGLSVSMMPSEWVTTQFAFAWLKDDFNALFFGANRRRFEAPGNTTIFFLHDASNYDIDTYMISAGIDWKVSDALSYSGSFVHSKSNGETASGMILGSIPTIDGRIDNSLSSLSLGVQYQVNAKFRWSGSYVLDYYSDESFDELSGGLHSIMVGLTYAF